MATRNKTVTEKQKERRQATAKKPTKAVGRGGLITSNRPTQKVPLSQNPSKTARLAREKKRRTT